jgi:hypothetical protein
MPSPTNSVRPFCSRTSSKRPWFRSRVWFAPPKTSTKVSSLSISKGLWRNAMLLIPSPWNWSASLTIRAPVPTAASELLANQEEGPNTFEQLRQVLHMSFPGGQVIFNRWASGLLGDHWGDRSRTPSEGSKLAKSLPTALGQCVTMHTMLTIVTREDR